MQLSYEAKEKLETILREDISEEGLRRFTDEGINDLGVRLLYLTALCLKRRARKLKENQEEIHSQLP